MRHSLTPDRTGSIELVSLVVLPGGYKRLQTRIVQRSGKAALRLFKTKRYRKRLLDCSSEALQVLLEKWVCPRCWSEGVPETGSENIPSLRLKVCNDNFFGAWGHRNGLD